MGRLDRIRTDYEYVTQTIQERYGPEFVFFVEDIGYLLSLLEVHPASELPNTPRDVLAYQLLEGWTKAHYSGDAWRTRNGKFLSDVVCWQEQPVFPKKYVEGARK